MEKPTTSSSSSSEEVAPEQRIEVLGPNSGVQSSIKIEGPGANPIPLKIPPPPTEGPTPYTPFGGQTSTLLPGNSLFGRGGANRRIVRPPGLRKYAQYFTPLNLTIAFIVFIALCVFIYMVHRSNVSDIDKNEPLEGAHVALKFVHRPLGEFKDDKEKISFDEEKDIIILSSYDPSTNILRSEIKNISDHLNNFIPLERNMTDKYYDCIQFTDDTYCCSTSLQSRHHKTDCFLAQNGTYTRSTAVKYDFMYDWHGLINDEKLVILRNRQKHSVLDLKIGRVHSIEEKQLPYGYYSVAFSFPLESPSELDELVRRDDEFRVCQYFKTSLGDYSLKEQKCEQTPFKVEFELKHVKFCTTPLYVAVVQYGHLNGEDEILTWRLRVKYDNSREVYSSSESLDSRVEQLAMHCNENELTIFAMGEFELHEYTNKLPNLRSEHFIVQDS